ncbi:MAG: hypothetical protein ACLRWQ_21360 [Flavonifractor plautii]
MFAVVGQMGLFLLILLVVVVVCAADGWRYRRYRRRYLLPGMPPPPWRLPALIFGRRFHWPRPPRPPGARPWAALPPGCGGFRGGGRAARGALPAEAGSGSGGSFRGGAGSRRSRTPLMQDTIEGPRSWFGPSASVRHICVLYCHGKGGTAVEAHILVAEDEERLRTIIRDTYRPRADLCAGKGRRGGPGAAGWSGTMTRCCRCSCLTRTDSAVCRAVREAAWQSAHLFPYRPEGGEKMPGGMPWGGRLCDQAFPRRC